MGQLSIIVFSGICVLVASYTLWYQYRRSLARANGCLPPKTLPQIDPILGLDVFLQAGKLVQEIRYLTEQARLYNDIGRTYQTTVLGTSAINSIESQNLQAVFVSQFGNWGVEPIRLSAAKPFLGRGFLTTDGSRWEHSRTLLKPSFNKANIANMSTLEKYLKMVMDRIPADGSTVDLQPLLLNLYLDTATIFLFGESIDSLSGSTTDEAQNFLEAFDYAIFGTGMRIALGPFKFLLRDPKWVKAYEKVHSFVDRYIDSTLESRQAGFSAGQKTMSVTHSHNLLSAMAEQTTDKIELRSEILQALIGAGETTAILVSNVFFALSRHPDVWRKLRNEVLSIGTRELDFDLLQSLHYLRKVLNESLRLYPVFHQLDRVALVSTKLPAGGGSDGASPIYCPAGTVFTTSFYAIHHLKSIWGPTAEEFDPDRWDTFKPATWEFVPFAHGPRACVGRQKALMEASYVIVRLLQEFRDIQSRDAQEWTGQVKLTAKNANGCKVGLVRA